MHAAASPALSGAHLHQRARLSRADRGASAGRAYAFTKVTTKTALSAAGGRVVVELGGQARGAPHRAPARCC